MELESQPLRKHMYIYNKHYPLVGFTWLVLYQLIVWVLHILSIKYKTLVDHGIQQY